jgi:hypothetical protein
MIWSLFCSRFSEFENFDNKTEARDLCKFYRSFTNEFMHTGVKFEKINFLLYLICMLLC